MGLTIFKYVFLIALVCLCGYMIYNLTRFVILQVKMRKEKKKSEINKKEHNDDGNTN